MITTRKEWILNALVVMPILSSCCSKREKNEICLSKTLALVVLSFSHTSYIYMQVLQRLKRRKKVRKSRSGSIRPFHTGRMEGRSQVCPLLEASLFIHMGRMNLPCLFWIHTPLPYGVYGLKAWISFVFLDESIPFLRDKLHFTWKRYIKWLSTNSRWFTLDLWMKRT